ncbi:MAG TPA: 2-C-methyl-D-erythritol 4-phosphate cytidylyltransferase [Candidatus Polarisedimenticolia bacterium]|nr:2-C-methyl-D-erythritol 4-phosphate cytidylyltransferase [Candidatus Polarisedimenticolia bacterium]
MDSSPLAGRQPPDCAAILVAAGRGVRAGAGEPKQFRSLGGVPLLARTVLPFVHCEAIARLVLVVPNPEDARRRLSDHLPAGAPVDYVQGGDTRQQSSAAGLAAAGNFPIVLVHDGARPFVDEPLIRRVLEEARRSGAAVPLVPVSETLRRVDSEGASLGTVRREEFALAQTPQGFRKEVLERALRWALESGFEGTDEAELVEKSGQKVTRVEGSAANIKITTPEDLARARRLLDEGPASDGLRVGIGYDIHALVSGRELILGGVKVPHPFGPAAHSDGDLICHAATDALLGAAGLPDIGQLFPDTDPEWKSASSLRLLEEAASRVRGAGYRLVNLDLVLVAEEPRLVPHLPAIRTNLARALHCSEERIGVKGKRGEGIGFAGRREGMAAQAVVLLAREEKPVR